MLSVVTDAGVTNAETWPSAPPVRLTEIVARPTPSLTLKFDWTKESDPGEAGAAPAVSWYAKQETMANPRVTRSQRMRRALRCLQAGRFSAGARADTLKNLRVERIR